MSKETPMFDCIGLMPSADRPSNTVCSYLSVHDDLGAKSKSYAAKYQQFVVDYAVEWEKIVSTRIDAGIKKAEALRIELDHYQKKYEALRLTANQNMAKGKSVASGHQEKLARNEEKLLGSKQIYNKVATDLCILMEEVTERSWRDVHPLLVKVAQFDMTLANDEAKALAALSQVVNALKQVATDNGLSPQPRLKDWATLKPETLSTRPGGVADLTIEAGPAFAPIAITSEMALPPGSVGPQGMVGFPIQIASPSNNDPFATSSGSVASFHSAPDPFGGGASAIDPLSTSFHNMLSVQTTAPAPTIDDVYGRRFAPSSTHSAPPSGNFSFPALPASTTPNSNWGARSTSFNDNDSAYSGYSAPMSAPPQPPSMPPPPPPPATYGAYPIQQQQQQPQNGYGGGWSQQPPPPQQQPMMMSPAPPMQSQPVVNPISLYGAPPPMQSPPNNANPNYNPFG